MEEVDNYPEYESPHNIDYEMMHEHVFQGDHELLHLDTYLRELLSE